MLVKKCLSLFNLKSRVKLDRLLSEVQKPIQFGFKFRLALELVLSIVPGDVAVKRC